MHCRSRRSRLDTGNAASRQLIAANPALVDPTQRRTLERTRSGTRYPGRTQNAVRNARLRATFRLTYPATVRVIGIATQQHASPRGPVRGPMSKSELDRKRRGKRWSLVQARQVMEQWQASGKSAVAFAAEHGFSAPGLFRPLVLCL